MSKHKPFKEQPLNTAVEQPMDVNRWVVWTKVNLVIIMVCGLLYAGIVASQWMAPILVMLANVFVLYYLLVNPVAWLSEKLAWVKENPFIKRQALAVAVVYTVFLAFILFISIQGLPPLFRQLKGFSTDLPYYLSKVDEKIVNLTPPQFSMQAIARLEASIAEGVTPLHARQAESLKLEQAYLIAKETYSAKETTHRVSPISIDPIVQELINQFTERMMNWGISTFHNMVYVLATLVVLFYLLSEQGIFRKGISMLLPRHRAVQSGQLLDSIHEVAFGFIRGQFLLAWTAGMFMVVVCQLLGLQYALFLGVFFGAASFLPVIGPWFGIIPILLMSLFNQHEVMVIPIIILTCCYYMVKTYWIMPRVLKMHTTIHPAVIIMAVLFCLHVIPSGAGLLLTIPFSCVVTGFYRWYCQDKCSVLSSNV